MYRNQSVHSVSLNETGTCHPASEGVCKSQNLMRDGGGRGGGSCPGKILQHFRHGWSRRVTRSKARLLLLLFSQSTPFPTSNHAPSSVCFQRRKYVKRYFVGLISAYAWTSTKQSGMQQYQYAHDLYVCVVVRDCTAILSTATKTCKPTSLSMSVTLATPHHGYFLRMVHN